MNEVCRLCLRSQDCTISVFSEKDEARELRSQIMDCCCIKIVESDALPKLICTDCKTKLSSVYKFIKLCKESDQTLRRYYKIPFQECRHIITDTKPQDVSIQTDLIEFPQTIERSVLERPKQTENTTDTKVIEQDLDRFQVKNLSNEHSECMVVTVEHPDNAELTKGSTDCTAETGEESQRKSYRKTRALSKYNRHSERLKKKETFTCHTCKKTYASKQALLKHTKCHVDKGAVSSNNITPGYNKNEVNGTDLKCSICKESFKDRVKLNSHLRLHDKEPSINKEMQYLCDICSRTFASKTGLRFHLKAHNGPKSHNCKYCNKSFPIQSYKNRHERTHTGVKHFVCHVCSATFASSNGLMYHLRIHTGEANYQCKTCGKSFTRLKYLKEHTFTHTGERPFVCKLCGSAYGNSGSLYVHQRKCKIRFANNENNRVKKEILTEENDISCR